MVKQIKRQNKKLFYCEDCLLLYKNKEWAEKCEDWCKKKNSCKFEITKHSMKEVYDG